MGQCESIGESGAEYVHSDQSSIAWYTYYSCLYAAGVFALASVAVSFCLIYKHLSYYTSPMHQRYIVRILLMVPFYSVDSWLSFMFPRYSVYFDVVRDCYEAFVIYNFFLLLLNSIGGFQIAQKLLVGRQITLLFPFNCIHFTATGHGRFLLRCKNGTLQYVVIRPLMTFVAVFAHAANAYCPGDLHPTHVSLYTATVNFVSVTIAMYALITFYDNLSADLKPCKPLPKFLSIKFVIFFSFWQGLVVSGLMKVHIIRQTASWTADDIGVGVQSFLICIEMTIAAVVHIYAFGYSDFRPADRHKSNIWKSVRHVISPRDLLVDLSIPVPRKKMPRVPINSSSSLQLKPIGSETLGMPTNGQTEISRTPSPTDDIKPVSGLAYSRSSTSLLSPSHDTELQVIPLNDEDLPLSPKASLSAVPGRPRRALSKPLPKLPNGEVWPPLQHRPSSLLLPSQDLGASSSPTPSYDSTQQNNSDDRGASHFPAAQWPPGLLLSTMSNQNQENGVIIAESNYRSPSHYSQWPPAMVLSNSPTAEHAGDITTAQWPPPLSALGGGTNSVQVGAESSTNTSPQHRGNN